MATLQELQNLHEELIEICGNFVATVAAVNGDEDAGIVSGMNICAERAKMAMLAVCANLSKLMAIKREAG